jgi:hypothetical protein
MIYNLIGRRERGKTTLGYGMARKLRKRIIIDARQMIQRIDVVRIHRADDLRPALLELVTDDAVSEVVYQPQDDDLEVAFDAWTAATKERIVLSPSIPFAVMVDEVSFYKLETARFQWLAKCTPREAVHIILTAHRPADIPTSIRAIADHWCIFSTTQEHDLDVIEKRSGSPRVVNAIRRLQGRSYVHWDDARGEMAVCDDPKVWFVALKSADRSIEVPRLVEPSTPRSVEDWELEP